MATLTVRNLPDDLVERIKTAARESERSMEQEIRGLLEVFYADRKRIRRQMEGLEPRPPGPITAAEIDEWKRFGRP